MSSSAVEREARDTTGMSPVAGHQGQALVQGRGRDQRVLTPETGRAAVDGGISSRDSGGEWDEAEAAEQLLARDHRIVNGGLPVNEDAGVLAGFEVIDEDVCV
jgi:hypothetical protein